MASTFLTAAQISELEIELFYRQLVLAATVTKAPVDEFKGDNGDEIILKVSTPLEGREQVTPGAAITYDDITESSVTFSMKHFYNATRVTHEQLDFDIKDFGKQVSFRQIEAVARKVEAELAAAMNAVAVDAYDVTKTNVDDLVVDAITELDKEDVPEGSRFLSGSPDFLKNLLRSELLLSADTSGSTAALRNATIGTYRGLTVVKSNLLTAGEGLVYHRSGIVFANKTPAPIPDDKVDSATATRDGYGLQHILQYESGNLRMGSVAHTYGGASIVEADRIWKLSTATDPTP